MLKLLRFLLLVLAGTWATEPTTLSGNDSFISTVHNLG